MSDYTTKTASLKATTIDTRKINAKQIDTKTLNINGISIDEKLKQAAIASRGNLMLIACQDGYAVGVIAVKDGQVLDEQIICEIANGEPNLGDGEKKYLLITHENDDCVFNIGTTVNKCITVTTQGFEEIKLKEPILTVFASAFELGEIDDNIEEIYGGAFWTGEIYILYQDNALTTILEQENSASTYSLRGENTSILDKLRQTVQENS